MASITPLINISVGTWGILTRLQLGKPVLTQWIPRLWTLLQPEYNQNSTSTLPLQSPWTTDLRFVFLKSDSKHKDCPHIFLTQIYPSSAEVQERIGTFLHSSGIQLWIQQADLAILAGEGLTFPAGEIAIISGATCGCTDYTCLSPRTENRTHVSRRFYYFLRNRVLYSSTQYASFA